MESENQLKFWGNSPCQLGTLSRVHLAVTGCLTDFPFIFNHHRLLGRAKTTVTEIGGEK